MNQGNRAKQSTLRFFQNYNFISNVNWNKNRSKYTAVIVYSSIIPCRCKANRGNLVNWYQIVEYGSELKKTLDLFLLEFVSVIYEILWSSPQAFILSFKLNASYGLKFMRNHLLQARTTFDCIYVDLNGTLALENKINQSTHLLYFDTTN